MVNSLLNVLTPKWPYIMDRVVISESFDFSIGQFFPYEIVDAEFCANIEQLIRTRPILPTVCSQLELHESSKNRDFIVLFVSEKQLVYRNLNIGFGTHRQWIQIGIQRLIPG